MLIKSVNSSSVTPVQNSRFKDAALQAYEDDRAETGLTKMERIFTLAA